MKLRHKLSLILFAWASIVWGASGAILAVALDERTTIPLYIIWIILGAFVAACLVVIPGVFRIGFYVKGVNDKMEMQSREILSLRDELKKLPCRKEAHYYPQNCPEL